MSDWFRGDGGELIEVRYLDIPDLPPGEIDEIVCGPMHLETMTESAAYITVAGLRVSIWAHRVKGERNPRLSITCEPDGCTRLDEPPTRTDGAV